MNDHTPPEPSMSQRWRRRFFIVVGLWLATSFLLSSRLVRGLVTAPLYLSDANAAGDAAYVMADGFAYWERLHGASDLYHMQQVPKIILFDEQRPSSYNFVRHQSETVVERAINYLEWHGVPRDKITTVQVEPSAWFGSLSEARAVASQMPELRSIVVVTSAPHTRRSRLCFRRSFPEDVKVQAYAPSGPSESWEVDSPIWLEYVKLLVYYIVA